LLVPAFPHRRKGVPSNAMSKQHSMFRSEVRGLRL
jgi:hypothetical protein